MLLSFFLRGVPQSRKELPGNVPHDLPAAAPRLRPLLPAMQRLVQQPRHGPATLRRQKAQEERRQSRPAGAAGQDPGHGRDERYGAALRLRMTLYIMYYFGLGI